MSRAASSHIVTASTRTVLVALAAVATLVVAIVVSTRALQGPRATFRARQAGPELVQAIHAATSSLLALDGTARAAQLRSSLPADAPKQAGKALVAQFSALAKASTWRIASACGYGDRVVKVVYDLAYADGHTSRVGFLLERRDGRLVFLDIAR